MQEGLENLQKRLLEMLIEINCFCKNHNLEIFLVGGSVLGAVRHKGFIPWDDDIDLAMKREDFERFEELVEKENPFPDMLYAPVYNKIVHESPIGHCYDKRHLERGLEHTAKIDIHPIDGVPEQKWKRVIQNFFSKVYYLSIYRMPAKNKGKRARAFTKMIVTITPNWLFDCYCVISKKIITGWKIDKSNEVCSLFGVAGYNREIMKKEMVFPLKEYQFCNEIFLGPALEDAYLKQLYGTYMILPPMEERTTRHGLEKSYIEEEKK